MQLNKRKRVVVGLDIGYGYVKMAWSTGPGENYEHVMPAGAAPKSRLPTDVAGQRANCGGLEVLVNGEHWVGGVDPGDVQGMARQLNEYYPSTSEYLALFHAALVRIGEPVIDELVTGLPMTHYLDEGRRRRLAERLTGMHPVRGGQVVEVRRVTVLPQPMGAFLEQLGLCAEGRLDDVMMQRLTDKGTCILSVDPGFYSTDYVLIRHNVLRDSSSGTSTIAVSAILDEARKQILRRFPHIRVSRDRLETALRDRAQTVHFGSVDVPFGAILDDVVQDLGGRLCTELLESLRSETESVDIILVAGGGRSLLEKPLRGAFPLALWLDIQDPQRANARGFLARARRQAQAAVA